MSFNDDFFTEDPDPVIEEDKKPVGNPAKNLDEIPIKEENPKKLFAKSKSVEESVKEFKEFAQKEMQDKRWKRLRVSLANLAKFFDFKMTDDAWNWLPKRFRDELNKQKVHVGKQRGRDYAIIIVDEGK
jgi:hypothetical protein